MQKIFQRFYLLCLLKCSSVGTDGSCACAHLAHLVHLAPSSHFNWSVCHHFQVMLTLPVFESSTCSQRACSDQDSNGWRATELSPPAPGVSPSMGRVGGPPDELKQNQMLFSSPWRSAASKRVLSWCQTMSYHFLTAAETLPDGTAAAFNLTADLWRHQSNLWIGVLRKWSSILLTW